LDSESHARPISEFLTCEKRWSDHSISDDYLFFYPQFQLPFNISPKSLLMGSSQRRLRKSPASGTTITTVREVVIFDRRPCFIADEAGWDSYSQLANRRRRLYSPTCSTTMPTVRLVGDENFCCLSGTFWHPSIPSASSFVFRPMDGPERHDWPLLTFFPA
jgi:hypothetical protein